MSLPLFPHQLPDTCFEVWGTHAVHNGPCAVSCSRERAGQVQEALYSSGCVERVSGFRALGLAMGRQQPGAWRETQVLIPGLVRPPKRPHYCAFRCEVWEHLDQKNADSWAAAHIWGEAWEPALLTDCPADSHADKGFKLLSQRGQRPTETLTCVSPESRRGSRRGSYLLPTALW